MLPPFSPALLLDPSVPLSPSTDYRTAASSRIQRARACHLSRLETLWSGPKFASPLEEIKVAAMETSGSDAAVTYSGRAEEGDYDLEHLPPLLEDEVREMILYQEVIIKHCDLFNCMLT